jgi:hypothetical protein
MLNYFNSKTVGFAVIFILIPFYAFSSKAPEVDLNSIKWGIDPEKASSLLGYEFETCKEFMSAYRCLVKEAVIFDKRASLLLAFNNKRLFEIRISYSTKSKNSNLKIKDKNTSSEIYSELLKLYISKFGKATISKPNKPYSHWEKKSESIILKQTDINILAIHLSKEESEQYHKKILKEGLNLYKKYFRD